MRRSPLTRRRKLWATACMCLGTIMICSYSALSDYAYGFAKGKSVFIPNSDFRATGTASGVMLSHSFRIYNLRPHWLEVEAEPDCGCTVTSWHEAVITPFGWKSLSVETRAKPKEEPERSVNIAIRTNNVQERYVFASVTQ